MKSNIPCESDWGNWQEDLDQTAAHGIYFGKSNEEMLERCLMGPIEAAGDIGFMPKIPFQYYVLGFRDSVVSMQHHKFELADAPSCFLRLVLDKLKNQPDYILPMMEELAEAVDHIADNQDQYTADIDIYGDFRELRSEIYTLWESQS